ncbi:unnamed protein product, partial [Linum tenue]
SFLVFGRIAASSIEEESPERISSSETPLSWYWCDTRWGKGESMSMPWLVV